MTHLQQVTVAYETASFTIEIDYSKTVANLKSSIIEKGSLALPLEQQVVLLYAGLPLDDSRTLSSYGLDGETELQLVVVEMIEVRLSRTGYEQLIVIEMRHIETVADLKTKVFQQYGIPIRSQSIKRSGFILNDVETMSSLVGDSNSHNVELQMDVCLTLTLEVYTGLSFQLEVFSNESVNILYAAVDQRARVSFHRQEIVYNGHVLERGRRICDYGIPDQATLVVNLREYEVMVFIKTLAGRTIMLTVSSRDTVGQVKAKIAFQEGIPVSKQRLIFVGEQLHDAHRLLDYRIEHESAVHLIFREGDTFEVYVDAPSGQSYVYEVDPKDSVDQLKNRLRDKEGIPCEIQQFFFEDVALQSDCSLRDSGITAGSTLRLSVDQDRSTQVFISMPSHGTFPLWVSSDQTVLRLKEMIAEKRHIVPELQELYFARNLLEDDKTLRHYTIESNHMIHVSLVRPPLLQFTVTMQGREDVVQCEEHANQTVQDIKQVLSKKLNVPIYRQQLFLGGCELEDRQKLSECGITNGVNLDLVSQSGILADQAKEASKAVLFVKTLTGKTVMVEVEPTDSVLSIKEQIMAKEGVAIDHQCLICGGRILDNEMTVSDCGMQNQSMLHLALRVPSHEAQEN